MSNVTDLTVHPFATAASTRRCPQLDVEVPR